MTRRDFLKATSALATTLVFPVTLTGPAIGKAWRGYYAAELFKTKAEEPLARKCVFLALSRRFKAEGFKEITDLSISIAYQPGQRAWLATATASFR